MRAPFGSHYDLLGVDPLSSAVEVRRAWAQLALKWHPDRAGADATSTFRKLAAAYAVLSDPASRAAYDRKLGIAKPTNGAPRVEAPPPVARPRAPAVMLSRLTGNLQSLSALGVARRLARDLIELFVDEADAMQGGMAMISMNVDVCCPTCSEDRATSCGRCGGIGKVRELFSAWLAIPPGVADGTLLSPSTPLKGMLTPVLFRVRTSPAGA